MNILKNEPALVSGLIQAILGLLLAFGVSLDDKQVGSIMAVTAVILAIAVRMVVTPTNKLPDATPTAPPEPAIE